MREIDAGPTERPQDRSLEVEDPSLLYVSVPRVSSPTPVHCCRRHRGITLTCRQSRHRVLELVALCCRSGACCCEAGPSSDAVVSLNVILIATSSAPLQMATVSDHLWHVVHLKCYVQTEKTVIDFININFCHIICYRVWPNYSIIIHVLGN